MPALLMRNLLLRSLLIPGLLLLTLAACTAPESGQDAGTAPAPASATMPTADKGETPDAPVPIAPEPAAPVPTDPAAEPFQAPRMSKPMPPLSEPAPPSAPASVPTNQSVVVDTGCKRDADCTIKNVGNCCGEYPACVNVDSPTDPAAVQAQCAQRGMTSVCGFPSITACRCVAGECQGDSGAVTQ